MIHQLPVMILSEECMQVQCSCMPECFLCHIQYSYIQRTALRWWNNAIWVSMKQEMIYSTNIEHMELTMHHTLWESHGKQQTYGISVWCKNYCICLIVMEKKTPTPGLHLLFCTSRVWDISLACHEVKSNSRTSDTQWEKRQLYKQNLNKWIEIDQKNRCFHIVTLHFLYNINDKV